ncbi:M20 aminoacylase family protein [Methylobacterium indicum]|uniref:M20 aminoacylase family protein n=1 Tax=Methylobacterium indicum TaxID=1775910 RepID=UPI0009E19874|nr:M20 aminoacylase family protein [Methylobacterium indicum]
MLNRLRGAVLHSPQDVLNEIRSLHPELSALRRRIHAHPELGFEEVKTAALVAEKLRAWGLEVTEGIGKTGVVGTLRGNRAGMRAIGLRADMDALPIHEETGLPHASEIAGIMHACGHDGHVAMLLGAARYLAEHPEFYGTVQFVFQPAEEGRGGARAMLEDGLFERFPCDAVYGLHNSPSLPVGRFATRRGAMMAACDRWSVIFHGPGGHGGSTPHLTADVSVALGYFLLGLQTIVSRNISSSDQAVVSVGYIDGGSAKAPNVMPAEVRVDGVARSYTIGVRDILEQRIRDLAARLAAAQDCTAEVSYRRGGEALVNHDKQVALAIASATALVGAGMVDGDLRPSTGGEDFARMLQRRPGAFMLIGAGAKSDNSRPGLHTPRYDFNDEIIPMGAAYWVELVRTELATP